MASVTFASVPAYFHDETTSWTQIIMEDKLVMEYIHPIMLISMYYINQLSDREVPISWQGRLLHVIVDSVLSGPVKYGHFIQLRP